MSRDKTFSAKVLAAVTLCLQGAGTVGCGGIASEGGDETESQVDRLNPPDADCELGECVVEDLDPDAVSPPDIDVVEPEPDPVEIPPQQVCDGTVTHLTEALNLPSPPEFLGVVSVDADEPYFSEATGTCLGETDTQGCIDAIALDSLPSSPLLFDHRYVLAVSGDVLDVINDVDGLRSFLGEIDTPTEVELILRAHSYNESTVGPKFSCGAIGRHEDNCLAVTDSGAFVGGGNNCESAEGTRELLCVDAGGNVHEREQTYTVYGECLGGRRPEGLEPLEQSRAHPGGKPGSDHSAAYFVQLFQLESAAVVAFSRLAVELEERGAPRALIERARNAAQDEVRHAHLAQTRAVELGAVLPLPRIAVAPRRPRTLLDMAIENAEEGYVRESFGAAQALLHSKWVSDEKERQLWAEIAADELRHAELSREIGAWLSTRLTCAQRHQISEARTRAFLELESELRQKPSQGANLAVSQEIQVQLLLLLSSELAPALHQA